MIKFKKPESNFIPAPEGTHPARCIQVVEMGMQPQEWKGEKWDSPKIMIFWELPTEKHVFTEERGEEPFVVNREYTATLTEKSNLLKDLVSWLGKKTNEEWAEFDIASLVGQTCMVVVVHKDSNGKTYSNVTGVSKLMKNIKVPKAINPTLAYSISDGEGGTFGKLFPWVQKKIQNSLEFKEGVQPEDESQEQPEETNEAPPWDEDAAGEELWRSVVIPGKGASAGKKLGDVAKDKIKELNDYRLENKRSGGFWDQVEAAAGHYGLSDRPEEEEEFPI